MSSMPTNSSKRWIRCGVWNAAPALPTAPNWGWEQKWPFHAAPACARANGLQELTTYKWVVRGNILFANKKESHCSRSGFFCIIIKNASMNGLRTCQYVSKPSRRILRLPPEIVAAYKGMAMNYQAPRQLKRLRAKN